MGIYLVDIGSDDWADEDTYAPIAQELAEELDELGLPPYTCPPEPADGTGERFDVKINVPMDSFGRLCRAHDVSGELLDWEVLIPVDLDEEIELPAESAYTDTTRVAGAPAALAAARHLAEVLGLPPGIPATSENLFLNSWFADRAQAAAALHPGPWTEDLDAAFHVTVHLRAAEFVLRTGRPVTYS
ncbi:hypothetical protein ACFXDE_17235 [Kitasatospora sp. NPDC059408]|uniref:hypothetical protein n=1 Tax=Kitasatospora sp. NPDC059408 TaxID=3346823 RepID=UPI003699701F